MIKAQQKNIAPYVFTSSMVTTLEAEAGDSTPLVVLATKACNIHASDRKQETHEIRDEPSSESPNM